MSRRHEIGVGCLVVVATGLLALMAVKIGALKAVGTTLTATAQMADAAGLSEGAVVSIAGVQVGRVESLAVDFDHATVTLSIEKTAGVRSDASVAIRARSVLGEKYVELVPLSKDAPLLEDGGTLQGGGTTFEIDQLVNRMGPVMEALDPEVFRILGEALKEDPERAKRMLADVERILHNSAVASDELPALMADGRATMASVRTVADDAGPVIAHADATLAKTDELLDRTQSLLASVPPERVDSILDEIEGGVKDGRVILQTTQQTAKDAQQFVDGWKDVDWREFRRLAQEQGVFIRLTPYPVDKEQE